VTSAHGSPLKTATKAPKRRKWRSPARSAPALEIALARLGRRIRRLRLAKGLSQEDAAERASIDPKHYQAIEGGRMNLTMASLLGIARALGVKVADLTKGV
jgi:ribosome-binding protein aMBF1 (putative translation factor)